MCYIEWLSLLLRFLHWQHFGSTFSSRFFNTLNDDLRGKCWWSRDRRFFSLFLKQTKSYTIFIPSMTYMNNSSSKTNLNKVNYVLLILLLLVSRSNSYTYGSGTFTKSRVGVWVSLVLVRLPIHVWVSLSLVRLPSHVWVIAWTQSGRQPLLIFTFSPRYLLGILVMLCFNSVYSPIIIIFSYWYYDYLTETANQLAKIQKWNLIT